jgi:hypothetical protein
MSKYHARKTERDGIVFDSAAEANRYDELKLLERSGDISHLVLQPEFDCVVNGKHVCKYRADFQYVNLATQAIITEDVKGFRTAVYRLKKKLVEALHGIAITEVGLPFSGKPLRTHKSIDRERIAANYEVG